MNKRGLPKGVFSQCMCKCLLQEYTQKACIALPVYQNFNEKTAHGNKYKSHVWVDGICFKSLDTFTDEKLAKDDAAKHVLINILEKVKSDEPVGILEDTTVCKSIVNEYVLTMNKRHNESLIKMPTYTTESTKALFPMFISSLELNGATYVGKPAKNKRDAEKLAARSAILSILDSKSNISYTTTSAIVKSKFKFYEKLKTVKDLISPQAHTANVGSGVGGATFAEIPHPSPLVPSSQVLDVNQDVLLESAVKQARESETTAQDQAECFHLLMNPEVFEDSTSAVFPSTELVIPRTEFVPPAQGPAFGKKNLKKRKRKLPQSPLPVAMIDSSGLLSVDDKSNEAPARDGGAIADISQPNPLVPSGNVPNVNEPLPSALKRAFDTTSDAQPELSPVFKKSKLKDLTSAITPELVVPHIALLNPAFEPAPASTKKKYRRKNKGKITQPPLSVAMVSQSSPPVTMIGALLSVDENDRAHGVDGSTVGEIPEPSPFVPSSQVTDVNQNVLLDSAVKQSPESTAQEQPECINVLKKPEVLQASTSAVAPPTELVNPCTDVHPPAQGAASGKNNRKRKKQQLPQSSLSGSMTSQSSPPVAMIGALSSVDNKNVVHGVKVSTVGEIPQPCLLVPSSQVPDVNMNVLLESNVKLTPGATAQDQPECIHVLKKPELLQTSTSAAAPLTELVNPCTDDHHPAQGAASGKKKSKKKKQLPQSSLPVAMIDKSNEAHARDGGAVAEISQLSPLMPSEQVPDVNEPLPYAVKRAPETTSEAPPEFSQDSETRKLKSSTSAITPESVVPHIELAPPASELASTSTKKKYRRKHKEKVHQPAISVAMISQSSPPVALSGTLLSVDENNKALVVDGSAVGEIPRPSPLVPSSQVPGDNQNVLLESVVKQAVETTAQDQLECIHVLKKPKLLQASASAVAPPTELEIPLTDVVPPVQGAASGKKIRKKKKQQVPHSSLSVAVISQSSPPVAMIGTLSSVDKNNEAHGVDGSTVREIPQPSPLVPSSQVADVNHNVILESAVKPAPESTAQEQPECINVVPLAQDTASGKKKTKKKKHQLPQSSLPISVPAEDPGILPLLIRFNRLTNESAAIN